MTEVYWAVKILKKEIDLEVYGVTVTQPASFIEGMVGFLPVFSTKEAAVAFAGREDLVHMIQTIGQALEELE